MYQSKLQHISVRLACVRHAASVRPEPGSNSPIKSIASSLRRLLTFHRALMALEFRPVFLVSNTVGYVISLHLSGLPPGRFLLHVRFSLSQLFSFQRPFFPVSCRPPCGGGFYILAPWRFCVNCFFHFLLHLLTT